MAETLSRDNWYKDFFQGKTLELWRRAKSLDQTEAECAFLQEVFDGEDRFHLLDVPCGNGRLSVPMAQAGFKITGVDYSEEFTDEAANEAKSAKLSKDAIQFIRSDMRTISFKQKFDGAFCLGNSFGYFDREGTAKMFNAISGSLKTGAKFVLDSVMTAETFLVDGAKREWVRVGDMLMLVENRYNCRESCVETDYIFVHDGKEEIRRAVHWIYTTGEICSMLEKVDFKVLELFGSTECDSYELGSEKLLLVAEKK